jgi:hypothetical protein
MYQALSVIAITSATGLARRWPASHPAERAKIVACLISSLVSILALIGYITFSPTGAQGRYVFPSISALMTLAVLGITSLVPQRAARTVTLALPAAMLAFAIFVYVGVLVPVYTPPPALAALPASATPVEAVLGDTARLAGYEISHAEAVPGDRVFLTLYWQPLNRTALPYSIFVHLLAEDDQLIAQRDTYPGLGRYATNGWEPGRLFADTVQVLIPEAVVTPVTARWKVGLWQTETGDRAWRLGADGQPVDSGVTLGELRLQARQP